ncbi:MAG: hypothetical protein AB7O67_16715 [Vicinamibacterales bacterium]
MAEQGRFSWHADPVTWANFLAYHQANPQIYDKLRDFALEAKAAGRERLGIAVIFERLRWYTAVEARQDGEPWKVNNSWRAFYARLLMEQEPELDGFFETRRSHADVA